MLHHAISSRKIEVTFIISRAIVLDTHPKMMIVGNTLQDCYDRKNTWKSGAPVIAEGWLNSLGVFEDSMQAEETAYKARQISRTINRHLPTGLQDGDIF